LLVAGKPRRLTPRFWRLFTLLYRQRGDVIENDRLYPDRYGDMEQARSIAPASGLPGSYLSDGRRQGTKEISRGKSRQP
jgi:hypothetical protein